jgi:serine protease Do
MSDDLRKKFKIKDSVKGVVITGVDAERGARQARQAAVARRRHRRGAVRGVGNPADAAEARIDQLKSQGKKIAVLLVSNGDGETRFVALNLQ